ncbi:MAG: class I SAM-dependent methyltransferase [Pseudomonadales bacterium]|nr:class I SAM-dependent methyltransferase [Pseudomonadales bacterium]
MARNRDGNFRLHYAPGEGYSLYDEDSGQRPLHIDFTAVSFKRRLAQSGREPLLRAARAGAGKSAVDCTAGLGTDAFLLASRGCQVTMVERSATLCLMLDDALARARRDPDVGAIASRINLVRGDSLAYLSELVACPDIVVIDPMFPSRRKTAEVRGALQILQRLIGIEEPVAPLIMKALALGCRRVVVKRPRLGGKIEGLSPVFSAEGRASRFDVFVAS